MIRENEVHILLQCPLYDDLRYNLMQHINDTDMSQMEQFNTLLSNPELQALLGKVTFKIMERRDIFKNVFSNLK